jgi:murein DD-endopeptidase MepM/ murein hydrolase activator NlpD
MMTLLLRRMLFICLCICPSLSVASPPAVTVSPDIAARGLVAPVEGIPRYPFTREEAIRSGRWRKGSQDLPHFGAPRNSNTRRHAGIDIYPEGGEGTPVRAMADGTIIKVARFYTRANGEVTYGVLVDHNGFVAHYAELRKPETKVGTVIRQGETIGRVSGTKQLHLEFYAKGTTDWTQWYGNQPDNLIDPTAVMLNLLF